MPVMRLPPDVAHQLALALSLGVVCDATGAVAVDAGADADLLPYPPPGYLPWRALEVGNGDTYGFYWPIGREAAAPVVCTVWHNEWAVLPLASSLDAAVRLHVLTGAGDPAEWLALAAEAAVPVDDLPALAEGARADEESEELPYWGAWDAEGLLAVDPASPHLLWLAAKRAVADRRYERAEGHLRAALAALPEYAEALALLGLVYRQTARHAESAGAMMEALTAPYCFGASNADRRRLLGWLGRMKDATCAGPDPLWARRAELRLDDGDTESADYRVFESLIEAYHVAGMGARAVRLRVAAGELMTRETISFQERGAWTSDLWRQVLVADLERAGLPTARTSLGTAQVAAPRRKRA